MRSARTAPVGCLRLRAAAARAATTPSGRSAATRRRLGASTGLVGAATGGIGAPTDIGGSGGRTVAARWAPPGGAGAARAVSGRTRQAARPRAARRRAHRCVAAGAVAASVGSSGLAASAGADRRVDGRRRRPRDARRAAAQQVVPRVTAARLGERRGVARRRRQGDALPRGPTQPLYPAGRGGPCPTSRRRRDGAAPRGTPLCGSARAARAQAGSARSWGSGRLRPPCTHGLSPVADPASPSAR